MKVREKSGLAHGKRRRALSGKRRKTFKIGYVPLVDVAPIVVAKELKLFEKYGVSVDLQRELGWASIRDKMVFGELQLAHAPAGLVFSAHLGLNCQARPSTTGLIINCHGNGITISKKLYDRGVNDSKSMGAKVKLENKMRRYTFATVSMVSSHNFLLRQWLRAGGIDPERDVRVVVIPPTLMGANLKEGNIDGFCVGEPWNSIAANDGSGVVIHTSKDLSRGHPEKVLMASHDFITDQSEAYVRIGAAVLEACKICSNKERVSEVAKLMAQRIYLNLNAKVIEDSLLGKVSLLGKPRRVLEDFHVFYDDRANAPMPDKATWVWRNLEDGIMYPYLQESEIKKMLEETFRMDLFYEIEALMEQGLAGKLVASKGRKSIQH